MLIARVHEWEQQMTGIDHGDMFVGRQVRVIRARRGLTQQVLADRVGVSRGAIAKYEAGERPIDSRKLLHALAAALSVDIGDLTGHEHERLGAPATAFHAAVPEIETAFWTAGNITDVAPARRTDSLIDASKHAARLQMECEYATLAPLLPALLTDLYRRTRDGSPADQHAAWDALAQVAFSTSIAMRARGYTAVAWSAAQEAERAAQMIDSLPGHAAATFARSQVLLSRPGALKAALDCVEDTAERISSDVRTVGEVQTLGMLHLQASLVTAASGGDPEAHLDEAAEQAARLDKATASAASILGNPTFGSPNVALWKMSAAMEVRDADAVLHLARQLDPHTLPTAGRTAQYFVEVGRAASMKRNYPASIHALLRAEHIAPQQVRNMTHVRELVGHTMRKARRNLTTGDLGRLAQRVGVVPA
ncbi:helix-turn-helix transcriptional regulator [Nocardia sp. NPDC058497]|uniref:helix-turn-helix transcriptional regulator n=1 Tax=Nocardia sp. NPDC058497 TaxID=3346529 RepID=UPI003658226B